MKRFYDPSALVQVTDGTQQSAARAASTLQGITALGQGLAIYQAGAGNARQARTQAALDAGALARLRRDEARDTGLLLGDVKARVAQAGGDAEARNLVLAAAAERSRTVTREEQATEIRARQLRARATNERRAGLIGGAQRAGSGMVESADLFNRLKRED